MKITSFYIIAFLLAGAMLQFLTAPCSAAEPRKGVDEFAINVFRDLAGNTKDNLVFSPASLESVLQLLEQGSAGKTLATYKSIPYGATGVPSSLAPLSATALFRDTALTWKPGPQADEIIPVAFDRAPKEAAKTINDWCADKTRGKITEIVNPNGLPVNTVLVAANAIYLKSLWAKAFDPSRTDENGTFTLSNGEEVRAAMMSQTGKFPYACGEGWEAVALPYKAQSKGEPGYFIAIRPTGNVREFAAGLTPELYNSIRQQLNGRASQVRVVMPRFECEPPAQDLTAVLKKQGLGEIFSTQADYSKFCDAGIFLSQVLQKCYVKVDEAGTEAAAVTVGIMRLKAMPMGISLDKPFIWVIGDLTTAAPPLFMGICERP